MFLKYDLSEPIRLSYNYSDMGTGWDAAVRKLKYNGVRLLIPKEINQENFPIKPGELERIGDEGPQARILTLKMRFGIAAALEELQRTEFRPACFSELVAFGLYDAEGVAFQDEYKIIVHGPGSMIGVNTRRYAALSLKGFGIPRISLCHFSGELPKSSTLLVLQKTFEPYR